MRDIELSQLSAVSVDSLDELPRSPGLYFVETAKGEVLYIGRAADLRLRWRKHHRLDESKDLSAARIRFFLAPADTLPALEHEAIQKYRPPLNWKPWMGKRPEPTSTMAFRISKDLHQFYKKIADNEQRTLSQICRRVLESYRAKKDKDKVLI